MKTAISVPDEIYDHVERVSRRHGINRSQFYSAAAEQYAARLESGELTEAIDAVVDLVNADESTRDAVTISRGPALGGDGEW